MMGECSDSLCMLTFGTVQCTRIKHWVGLSLLFTPTRWGGVGGGHFLMKVTLLPTSLKETLWDPGKEHQQCSQGLCYCLSYCSIEMLFCFKFFVLDKQKDEMEMRV